MKRFLTWTAGIIGGAIAAAFVVRAVQEGRQRLRHALGQAEAIADRTRATIEQTETALREARKAI